MPCAVGITPGIPIWGKPAKFPTVEYPGGKPTAPVAGVIVCVGGGDDGIRAGFGSGQGMFVKSETLSAFPVISSNGMILGSVVGCDSISGSAGESGILIMK